MAAPQAFPFTRSVPLHVPPLEELADVLRKTLSENFEEVEVKVVTCPNLSEAPWNLSGGGLGGHPKILDIGGEKNLFYKKLNGASFGFEDVAKLAGIPNAFLIGPGAGASAVVGVNSELMANVNVGEGKYESYIAKMLDETAYVQEKYNSKTMGMLVNLLASEGKTGEVVYIRAAKRKGDLNIVSNIRSGLRAKYTPQGQTVGLGGVFRVTKGAVHAHIMPDFPKRDVNAEFCKTWLKYFNFHAPITCLSVLVTEDVGDLNLRVEHTHFFSDHGEGGHYHYDTTPKDIEYVGYYVPAEELWRIGQPTDAPSSCD